MPAPALSEGDVVGVALPVARDRARSGVCVKPMVRVVPIEPLPASRALGLLAGQGDIAADVKTSFAGDIEAMFGGHAEGRPRR